MIKLFGKFQLIVKNVKTGKITDTGWIDNLVLDNAFNFISFPLNTQNWFIELGTGSTVPTFGDTTLETFLIKKGGGQPNSAEAGASTSFSTPIYSTSAGWELTFNLGEVVGNVSEIGIAPLADNELITRALITDGAGDPTTITLGLDDILTVNYRIGYEMDTSHAPGSVTVDFDGTDIDLTARWVDLGKGASCNNGMNGFVFPYMNSGTNSQSIWILDVLPSDPLSDIDGGVTPASYLLDGLDVGGSWSSNLVATGSSWTKQLTYVSALGDETGDWNGVAIGSAASLQPTVLFEFDTTFTKAANQQVTITVKYEMQRA